MTPTPDSHRSPDSPGDTFAGDVDAEAYEPPSLTLLGSLAQITAGASGSYSDGSGFMDSGNTGSI